MKRALPGFSIILHNTMSSYENGQCVEGFCRGPSSMVSVDLGEGGKAGVNSQLNYNSDGLLLQAVSHGKPPSKRIAAPAALSATVLCNARRCSDHSE